MARVSSDADDFDPRLQRVVHKGDLKPFADSVLAQPEPLRERFPRDGHALCLRTILRVEVPAGEERNPRCVRKYPGATRSMFARNPRHMA
jgi:hypothetical protein